MHSSKNQSLPQSKFRQIANLPIRQFVDGWFPCLTNYHSTIWLF